MGLAVAGGCSRRNPAFYPEVADGRSVGDLPAGGEAGPPPDLLAEGALPPLDAAAGEASDAAVESPPTDAGPDVNVAPDGGPDASGTDAALDLPPPAPPSLLVGSPDPRPWYGGGSGGGVEYPDDRCPAGQVVIGHLGAISDENTFVGRLQIQCGSLRVTRTEPPFSVEVTPGKLLPARGTTNGVPWSALCPANHVVVSYAGQADDYVDSLRTACAQLEVSADRRGITFAAVVYLPAHGSGPAPAFEESCQLLGQVAAGADTRTGGWLDAIRPVCAPLIVVP
jgi:hypothetical protein